MSESEREREIERAGGESKAAPWRARKDEENLESGAQPSDKESSKLFCFPLEGLEI